MTKYGRIVGFVMAGMAMVLLMGAGASPSSTVPAPVLLSSPPPGFHPVTATQAQLAKYGFPPRPSAANVRALDEWTQAMKSWKHTVHPQFLTSNIHIDPIFGQDVATTGQGAKNWAGNQDTSHTYTSITGQWTVPSVTALVNDQSIESSWAGLGTGASSSNQLIQAGDFNEVSWSFYSGSYHPSYTHYLFWDIAPQTGIHPITNVPIYPYDTVYVNCWYTSGYAHFYLQNSTTGESTGTISEPVSGFSGSTAEWIVERPAIGVTNTFPGWWYALANFSSITFSDAEAEVGSTWNGVGVWPHQYWWMVDGYNDDSESTLATLGSINSYGDAFPVYFRSYGDRDEVNT